MSEVEVTIKVIQFSKAKNWFNWKELFLARANRKDPELFKCFNLDEDFPLEEEDKDGDIVPIEKNVKTMRKAYEELLMSLDMNSQEGLAAFNIVKWCKGNAREGL